MINNNSNKYIVKERYMRINMEIQFDSQTNVIFFYLDIPFLFIFIQSKNYYLSMNFSKILFFTSKKKNLLSIQICLFRKIKYDIYIF